MILSLITVILMKTGFRQSGKGFILSSCKDWAKKQSQLERRFSATISFPLDGGLQARCKQAVETQIALQEQQLANRRLDFEIARLKNCGELAKNGITFHPKSSYFKICSDVVVRLPNETVAPHVHSISLKQPATHAQPDSAHAGPEHVH